MPSPVLDLITPAPTPRKNPPRETPSAPSGAFERELGGDVRAAPERPRSGNVARVEAPRDDVRAEASAAEKPAEGQGTPDDADETVATGTPVPAVAVPPQVPVVAALGLSAAQDAVAVLPSPGSVEQPAAAAAGQPLPAGVADAAGSPILPDMNAAADENAGETPDLAQPSMPQGAKSVEKAEAPAPAATTATMPQQATPAVIAADGGIAKPELQPLAALAREGVVEIRGRVAASSGSVDGAAGETKPKPDAAPGRGQPKLAEMFAAAARGETAFDQSGDGTAEAAADQAILPLGQQRGAGAEQAIHRVAQPHVQTAASASVPVAALAGEIAGRAARGMTQFEIRLDPPELGRVDVRLEIDGEGRVISRLTVERAETLELMKADQRALERALEQAGLRMTDGGLQFQLRDGRGGMADRGSGFEGAGQGTGEGATEEDASQPYHQAPGHVLRTGATGVDIRI